jgi:2-polyprenyl-3-methyl-5-hydroxy-6-metoxy-1,4-benzoquinol methylase
MSMVCTGCGEPMAPYLEARDYNRGASTDVYRYERCSRCGMISLANVPADIGSHYAGYHDVPASLADLERGADHDRYKVALVRRFASGGRLLDIGSSWGAFCLLARNDGFEVEAIEMDPRCCEFIRTQLGIRAIQSAEPATALAQVTTPAVITIWHAIEHMVEPWAVLDTAASRLAPGGVLVVSTPNPDSSQFRLFGRFWAHLDAPRHLHLLPLGLLRGRMERAGLRTEFVTMRDEGGLACNDFGWRCSVANVSPLESIKSPLRLAGRLVGMLAAPLDRAEGRGTAYTAVFRKAP